MKYVLIGSISLLIIFVLFVWIMVPWVNKINLTGKYQLTENFYVDFPVREFQEGYFADGGSYVFGIIDNSGTKFFVIYPYDTTADEYNVYKGAYLNANPDLFKQPLKSIPTGFPLDRKVSDPF